MKRCQVHIALFVILCFWLSNATLSQSDKKNSKGSKYHYKVGPQPSNVQTRGLITPEPHVKDILVEHETFYERTHQKNFQQKVLGYVTPWHGHGYDIAKNFSSKFDYISPVWLQIRKIGSLEYEITGKHDINVKWMKDIRLGNPKVKIHVRVLFDGWTLQDYTSLFVDLFEQINLSKTLLDFCKKQKFDGIVLDAWSQIAGGVRSDVFIDFVILLSQNLKEYNVGLILVLPPSRGKQHIITAEEFKKLSNFVDAFSLMTYDYSSPQRPGPNSPIKWVKSCVEHLVPDASDINRSKILFGLNFYGNDYTISGGGPIIGHEFIKLLKEHRGKLKLDKESEENFFEVRTETGKHLVFYPTLYSISQRIQLARSLGTGLSIWELGQGLNYFYDLF